MIEMTYLLNSGFLVRVGRTLLVFDDFKDPAAPSTRPRQLLTSTTSTSSHRTATSTTSMRTSSATRRRQTATSSAMTSAA